MATAFITSSQDKAKAQRITALIDNGELPKPPEGTQKRNVCQLCQSTTLLRYYVPKTGYCCQACFDDWRTTPVWCSTRADDVHRGRVHIIPQCIIDAEAKQNSPQTRQDTRSAKSGDCGDNWVADRVAQIKRQRGAESIASEERWHAERDEGYARRNAELKAKAA